MRRVRFLQRNGWSLLLVLAPVALGGLSLFRQSPLRAQPTLSAEDLTGAWVADDGATYYVRQVGDTIWWVGMSSDQGRSFTNVYRGTIPGPTTPNRIAGDWADLPLGNSRNNGTLALDIVHIGAPPGGVPGVQLRKRSETGGFGASIWRRSGTALPPAGPESPPSPSSASAIGAEGLTGAWTADDGATYYVRQVGNTVWWLGLSSDQGRSFTNVFVGLRLALTSSIAGAWADLPLGNGRNAGGLVVRSVSTSAAPRGVRGVALQKQSQTGGFSASVWTPVPEFAGPLYAEKLKPISGRGRVLAILWDPRRPQHPAPSRAEVDRLLFGARPSVADWYRENSRGKYDLERAGVLGWYTADKSAEHYWDNPDTEDSRTDNNDPQYHQKKYNDGWLSGHVEKWAEAIRKADRDFNFAAYDTNRDKTLAPEELGILVVIPQQGVFGSVRPTAGREAPSRASLIVDGVKIPTISEWYTGSPLNLGTPAHEIAHHLLDAPDLYFDKSWPFAAEAYSIMDDSWRTAHLDPYEKVKLGWLPYRVATANGDYLLRDVETQGEALVLYSPQRGPGEYFLLENRRRGSSYDAGASAAGPGIPADGLAVWHILEDPALFRLVSPPTGDAGDWGRRGIRLIRANGGTPIDDTRALFDQVDATLSDNSAPANLRWLSGAKSGFTATLLTRPGPAIRVRITR